MDIYHTVLLKDVIMRNQIRNVPFLENLGGECKAIHNHSQSSRIPFTIFHGPQRGGGRFPPLSNSIDPNKTIGILRA